LLLDICCGLPIVIIDVAKYLRRSSEEQVRQFTAAVKDGRFIRELATNTWPEFVGSKGLLAWVDAELKACPESLKSLILYMLCFPREGGEERVIVRRKRLVWRWIAEGYIKNTGIRDMVTEAEERLRELEDLPMVMKVTTQGGRYEDESRGQNHGYQLSRFCGEVLMSRAAEDPLFLSLDVSALRQGKHSLNISRGCSVRHLTIDGRWQRNPSVFGSLDLSRLRSLTVSGLFQAYFISGNMKELRVLDLECCECVTDKELAKIPELVPRLRFLSLRGCRIARLPDSIGCLRQLQTLDMRRTGVTTLPSSILELRKLHCLRAGHTMRGRMGGKPYVPAWSSRLRGLASCSSSWQTRSGGHYDKEGVTMPRGFGSKLTALHTLGIVNVNTAGGEATLEQLRGLEQLHKLELYGISSYNVRLLPRLPAVDSLSLGLTRDATSSRSSIRLNDKVRRRLKLHGHLDILQVLPDDIWVLKDLTLEIHTPLTEGDMKHIRKLGWLLRLRLHFRVDTRPGGNKLKFDANDDLPQLQVLQITSEWTPLHVEIAPRALPNLEVLNCVGSLGFARGLRDVLPSLKEVSFDKDLGRQMRAILEGHPNKPALKETRRWCRYDRLN
jgi:hypothetical protein